MKINTPGFRLAAWLSVLFLVVVGAKLWVVRLYGSELPFWDQWVEANQFFRPWAEGKLTWSAWFAPHNEHRIFFTRLLDLSLIWLNGRWDPLLQMTVNAFIHAGFACGLAYCLWLFLGRKNEGLICFLLAPFFAMPYAAENTLRGFHSQQHFLSLGSLVAMAGLGFAKPGSRCWWLGLVAAIASLFTMGSGFLVSLAVVGLMVLRTMRARRLERTDLVTFGCGIAIVVLGLVLSVTVDEHIQFRVTSISEFFSTLAGHLTWPFLDHPAMVCVVALPLVILVILYFRPDFHDLKAAEFILTFGLWGILQSAALAYSRANYEESQASRYMDVLNVFAIASVLAVVLLSRATDSGSWPQWFARGLPALFVCVIFFGVWQLSNRTVATFLQPCRTVSLLEEENVKQFAATGDARLLLDEPAPRPDPRLVLEVLRNPALARILPSICRPPDEATTRGWLANGADWLLEHSLVILLTSLFLWVCLCGLSLACHELNLTGIAALLTGLIALGAVWSKRNLTGDGIAAELHKEITAQFSSAGDSRRARFHLNAAEQLQSDDHNP